MKTPIAPEAYRRERKRRGTQAQVAAQLGVTRETVGRRESGETPVAPEAWKALLTLPCKPEGRP